MIVDLRRLHLVHSRHLRVEMLHLAVGGSSDAGTTAAPPQPFGDVLYDGLGPRLVLRHSLPMQAPESMGYGVAGQLHQLGMIP